MSVVAEDAARLEALGAMPLYLRLQAGEDGLTLAQCREVWPSWRADVRARFLRHRASTADVLLTNALSWPPGMLHLAAAFVLSASIKAELRLVGAPFGTLNFARVTLRAEPDPLAAALPALLNIAEEIKPATVLSEGLLLRVLCDRMVQALSVLGAATDEFERARDWAARLVSLWPVQSRTCLPADPGEPMVRATCCFHDLNEGGARCGNCPVTSKPSALAS